MNIVIPKSLKLSLTVIMVAVILLLSLSFGYDNGRMYAQSEVVKHNVQSLSAGLEYFFQDQERYPTALEFADQPQMAAYFDSFPPENFTGSQCSESFIYKRPDISSYQLNYCLLKSFGGESAGWHKIEIQAATQG